MRELASVGIHEKKLRAQFGPRFEIPEAAAPQDQPLICLAFANRSGSNLLADYLRKTPVFAGFHEQLNFDTVQRTCDTQGLDSFAGYLGAVRETFGNGKPIYGFKASWDQLAMLRRAGISRAFADMRVVHVTREDVLDQAISYHVAAQTQQWTSRQEGDPNATPTYDYKAISKLMQAALQSEQLVRLFCEVSDVPRLSVTYAQIVETPVETVDRIAEFAGHAGMVWTPSEPSIKKQASRLNQEFRERFLDEARVKTGI
jgi:LPS sulfotransferase NodH